MTGKWNVTSNIIGGTKFFAVYRLRDVDAVDHSGNREYATEWLESRAEAEAIAEKKNLEGTVFEGNVQYDAFEQHMADFETQAAADFNEWFNDLQNVLDDNTATNLLNITNALDARVDLLEAVLFNDITANPFLILFDDLDGVTSTGIWNESLQRIEC